MKTYTIKYITDKQYRALRIMAAKREQSVNRFLLDLINKTTKKEVPNESTND